MKSRCRSLRPSFFFWGRRWRIYRRWRLPGRDSFGRYEEHEEAAPATRFSVAARIASHTARSGAMRTFAETTKSWRSTSPGSSFVRSTTPKRHGARGRPVAVTLPGEP